MAQKKKKKSGANNSQRAKTAAPKQQHGHAAVEQSTSAVAPAPPAPASSSSKGRRGQAAAFYQSTAAALAAQSSSAAAAAAAASAAAKSSSSSSSSSSSRSRTEIAGQQQRQQQSRVGRAGSPPMLPTLFQTALGLDAKGRSTLTSLAKTSGEHINDDEFDDEYDEDEEEDFDDDDDDDDELGDSDDLDDDDGDLDLAHSHDFQQIAAALGLSPAEVTGDRLPMLFTPDTVSAFSLMGSGGAELIEEYVETRVDRLQSSWIQDNASERQLFQHFQDEEKKLKAGYLEETASITDKLQFLYDKCLMLLHENERHAREVLLLRERQIADALLREELQEELARVVSIQGHLESICLDLQRDGPYRLGDAPEPIAHSSRSSSSSSSSSTSSSSTSSSSSSSSTTTRTTTRTTSRHHTKAIEHHDQTRQQGKQPSPSPSPPFPSSRSAQPPDRLALTPLELSPADTDRQLALQSLRSLLANDISDELTPPNMSGLPQENQALRTRTQNLLEMYRLRERHFASIVRRKQLECQLIEAKLKYQFNFATQEALKAQAYKEQITTLGKTERELRNQLSMYAEKFEQFQVTLTKSNDVFTTFKQEMERMTRTIKKLEKENSTMRKKCEQTDLTLLNLAEERNEYQRRWELAQVRTTKLEQICRALQNERRTIVPAPSPSQRPASPEPHDAAATNGGAVQTPPTASL